VPTFLIVFFLLSPSIVFAQTTRFDVRDLGFRNVVTFFADAPLEATVGFTSALAGWLEFDPEALENGMKGEFEVDTRTFSTTVEAKTEYIREKLLKASDHPTATFRWEKLVSPTQGKLTDGEPVLCLVEGWMVLRGVRTKQNLSLEMTYFKESAATHQRLPGNLLKVASKFEIAPGDFKITPPGEVASRFPSKVRVEANFVGSDRTAPATPPLAVAPE